MGTSLETLLHVCESEKLHLSGQIQSFGALIRLDPATRQITHASANLGHFIDADPSRLIGQSIDCLTWLSGEALSSLSDKPGTRQAVPGGLDGVGGPLAAMMLRGAEAAIIIELEYNLSLPDPIRMEQLQSFFLSPPADDDELGERNQQLVRGVGAITGYDRVMLYRFHGDWSGEVITEEISGEMGGYLGQRFPASDIPSIARNLYLINPARAIPEITAAPVAILGMTASPPDLTWSDLRSVSPVHLEYLGNMGVGASFSVPIRVSGRLWGLVACHHRQARRLSPDLRSACVNLTNLYNMGLTSYLAENNLRSIAGLDDRIEKMGRDLCRYEDPLKAADEMADRLVTLLNAQGFAMVAGREAVIAGDGPDSEEIGLIDAWFLQQYGKNTATTDHLKELLAGGGDLLAKVSGMVAIKVNSERFGPVRLYWFRPSESQEITWAGDPQKPIEEKAGVVMISPRRSFEKWIEVRTGYSRPWSKLEQLTAIKLRSALLEHL